MKKPAPCEIINIVQEIKIPKVQYNNIAAQSVALYAISLAIENKAKKEENKTLLMVSLLYKLLAKRLITGL